MNLSKLIDVWETKTDSPIDKLVLCAIASFTNGQDVAWPSISSIQRRTCLSESTVHRSILSLKAKGFIETNGNGGRHCVNTYRIVAIKGVGVTPFPPRNGVTVTEKGVTVTGKGVSVTPQLYRNCTRTNGEGNPPKFVSELNTQIHTAEKERTRLKDFFSDGDGRWADEQKRLEFLELGKRIKTWKTQMLQL